MSFKNVVPGDLCRLDIGDMDGCTFWNNQYFSIPNRLSVAEGSIMMYLGRVKLDYMSNSHGLMFLLGDKIIYNYLTVELYLTKVENHVEPHKGRGIECLNL